MENLIKKILVPMDGSRYSKMAASEAISIGKKFDSKIIFVTAISYEKILSTDKVLGILKNDKKTQKAFHDMICILPIEATKILKDQVTKCNKVGISATYEILDGDPISAILIFSKKLKPDLIVIGSHGLAGLAKIKALGSVSRNVSESSKCPVLIVR